MSFSLNRFIQLTKADLTENKVLYLSIVIGSFAVMVIMAVLFNHFDYISSRNDMVLRNFFYSSSFIITMLTICLAFWDIPSKGKLINLVQRPASMLEKFLERIILFVFLFPLIQRVFFLIVEYIRVIFLPRFEGDWFMSIYGRGDGQSLWDFFMDIDTILFPAIMAGWCVISLAVYMAATFGGLKSFVRFMASFAFGLVVFSIFLVLIIENLMDFSTDVVISKTSDNSAPALILGGGAIFAATSLAVKSLICRNVNFRFKGVVGFLATIGYLAIMLYVFYVMIALTSMLNIDMAIVIMTIVCCFNSAWLLCGAYINFAHRQLNA